MQDYQFIDEFVLTERVDGQTTLVIDKNRKSDLRIQRWVMDQLKVTPFATTDFVSLGDLKTRRDKLKQAIPRAIAGETSERWSDVQRKMVGYLALAQQMAASDIHITVRRSVRLAIIEMRIHGELEIIDELTSEEGDSLVSTLFMSMFAVRVPPTFDDGDFQAGRVDAKFARSAGLFGARYKHVPTVDGVHVVLRTIIDDSDRVPTLEQQVFLPEQT